MKFVLRVLVALLLVTEVSGNTLKEGEVLAFEIDRSVGNKPTATYYIRLAGWPESIQSWCEGVDLYDLPFCGGVEGDTEGALVIKRVKLIAKGEVDSVVESVEGEIVRQHTTKRRPSGSSSTFEIRRRIGDEIIPQKVLEEQTLHGYTIEGVLLSRYLTKTFLAGDNLMWVEPKRLKRMRATKLGSKPLSVAGYPGGEFEQLQYFQLNPNTGESSLMFDVYYNSSGLPVYLGTNSGRWKLALVTVGQRGERVIELNQIASRMKSGSEPNLTLKIKQWLAASGKLESVQLDKNTAQHFKATGVEVDAQVNQEQQGLDLNVKQTFQTANAEKLRDQAAMVLVKRQLKLGEEADISAYLKRDDMGSPAVFVDESSLCQRLREKSTSQAAARLGYAGISSDCGYWKMTERLDLRDVLEPKYRLSKKVDLKSDPPARLDCEKFNQYYEVRGQDISPCDAFISAMSVHHDADLKKQNVDITRERRGAGGSSFSLFFQHSNNKVVSEQDKVNTARHILAGPAGGQLLTKRGVRQQPVSGEWVSAAGVWFKPAKLEEEVAGFYQRQADQLGLSVLPSGNGYVKASNVQIYRDKDKRDLLSQVEPSLSHCDFKRYGSQSNLQLVYECLDSRLKQEQLWR